MDRSSPDLECTLLLRVAKDQDHVALAELYTLTRAPLFAAIYRIVQDQQDAEDILQDCMATVWQRAGQYDPSKGKAIQWMRTVAKNKAIDRLTLKRRSTDRLGHHVYPDSRLVPERIAMPDELLLTKETLHEIAAALEGLSWEQREAIHQSIVEEISHREIAESLKEPLGTIKARIRRGLLTLRERLIRLERQGRLKIP